MLTIPITLTPEDGGPAKTYHLPLIESTDENSTVYQAAYAGTLAAIRDSRSSIDISLGKLGGQFDEQAIADAARKGWEAANDAGSRAPG